MRFLPEKVLKQATALEVEDKDFLLFCEEDLEEILKQNGGNKNEEQYASPHPRH